MGGEDILGGEGEDDLLQGNDLNGVLSSPRIPVECG